MFIDVKFEYFNSGWKDIIIIRLSTTLGLKVPLVKSFDNNILKEIITNLVWVMSDKQQQTSNQNHSLNNSCLSKFKK